MKQVEKIGEVVLQFLENIEPVVVGAIVVVGAVIVIGVMLNAVL